MFSLHDFVIDTILKMIGNLPDYQVQKYALGWYEKEVLTDEDMTLIIEKITEKNKTVEEPVIEEEFNYAVEEVIENTEEEAVVEASESEATING